MSAAPGGRTEQCPIKSCPGAMTVRATGNLADGRPVAWKVCDTCAKTVEHVGPAVPADHPTLFGADT